MKRNVIETVLGAGVLVAAVAFLGFSYSSANVGDVKGYDITADFSGIGGLGIGDDVMISGVKVGTVSKIELKSEDYMARVTMTIENKIKLPDDTSAFISSESLLGGKYMELQPGGSEEIMSAGGHVQYTQAPQNLEQLLGKFIFSMDSTKQGEAGDATAAAKTEPQAGGDKGGLTGGRPFMELQTDPPSRSPNTAPVNP